MPNSKAPLPIHSLSYQESPVQVRRIEHDNPYDFTQEHRHSYFEVFFFENGGGIQLIDFKQLPVLANSCYIVFPQQIHLLKRAPKACGRLVQFSEEIIPSVQLRLQLQLLFFSEKSAILFEKNKLQLNQFGAILDLLEAASKVQTELSKEITLHFLQALLLQLIDSREKIDVHSLSGDRQLLFRFQQILEEQYLENHQVNRYASFLNTTDKKLSSVTTKLLGITPLQVIHNRLLLEAKRLLLFENNSHKEIAFHLGFDSPASFSLFIKKKTGFSPSELNLQLVKIHK
ncbi:MAG: helix-turn-helix domain-containing protein [Bacteroidetes bacterium]|nr:helix-turn-helix domain-containing protein [Bacteroidota bacterium]